MHTFMHLTPQFLVLSAFQLRLQVWRFRANTSLPDVLTSLLLPTAYSASEETSKLVLYAKYAPGSSISHKWQLLKDFCARGGTLTCRYALPVRGF